MQGRLMLPCKPSSRRPAASTAARCVCWHGRSVRGSIRHPCRATSSQVQSHPPDQGHAALHGTQRAIRGACLPDKTERPEAENLRACWGMCIIDWACSAVAARRLRRTGPLHVAAGHEQRMLPALCTQPPLYSCLYLMPLICQNRRELPAPCTLHTSCTYKCPCHMPLTCTCRQDKGEPPAPCTEAALHRCLHLLISPATAGQEKRELPGAQHTACTVEMAQVHKPVAVAVVDEIQMVAERSRGWSFTRALLGVAAPEVHVCGDPAVLPLLEQMVDDTGEHQHSALERPRLMLPPHLRDGHLLLRHRSVCNIKA